MCQFIFAGFFEIFLITKCDKVILLQSVTDCYYKVRQILQSVTDCYYKMPQVLHSGGSEFLSYKTELRKMTSHFELLTRKSL